MFGHKLKCADKDEICANSGVVPLVRLYSRLFGGLGGRKVAAAALKRPQAGRSQPFIVWLDTSNSRCSIWSYWHDLLNDRPGQLYKAGMTDDQQQHPRPQPDVGKALEEGRSSGLIVSPEMQVEPAGSGEPIGGMPPATPAPSPPPGPPADSSE
jgi:hypothetical protein